MINTRVIFGIILASALSFSVRAETDCAEALKSTKCEDIADASTQIFKDCCAPRVLGEKTDAACEKKATQKNPAGTIALPVDDGRDVKTDGSSQAK